MPTVGEQLRVFLAVRVSAGVVAHALDFQRRLSEPLRGARWTHPDDLHVTLKFLGSTGADKIALLAQHTAVLCRARASFEVAFFGIDFFTPRRKPQILWGQVAAGRDDITHFVARLDEVLAAAGFPREQRPFQPHLTLARLSAEVLRIGEAATRREAFTPPAFCVRDVVLLASDLNAPPHAPRYRVLQVFPFEGTSLASQAENKI